VWSKLALQSPARLLHLKPTYLCLPCFGLGFPVLPTTTWLAPTQQLYAFILLPYYVLRLPGVALQCISLCILLPVVMLCALMNLDFQLGCQIIWMAGIIFINVGLILGGTSMYAAHVGETTRSLSIPTFLSTLHAAFGWRMPSLELTEEERIILRASNAEALSKDFETIDSTRTLVSTEASEGPPAPPGALPGLAGEEASTTSIRGDVEDENEAAEQVSDVDERTLDASVPRGGLQEAAAVLETWLTPPVRQAPDGEDENEVYRRIKIDVVERTLAALVPLGMQEGAAVLTARYFILECPITGLSSNSFGSRAIHRLISDTINEKRLGVYFSQFLEVAMEMMAAVTDCLSPDDQGWCKPLTPIASRLADLTWRFV